MKFTPEEISLCKQVAEKYKRFPRKGDWEYNDNTKEATLRRSEYSGMENPLSDEVNIFLIWTISDCLEFLREKRWNNITIEIRPYFDDIFCFAERGEVEKGYEREFIGEGKTPLEACLKVVLAVLEEDGK